MGVTADVPETMSKTVQMYVKTINDIQSAQEAARAESCLSHIERVELRSFPVYSRCGRAFYSSIASRFVLASAVRTDQTKGVIISSTSTVRLKIGPDIASFSSEEVDLVPSADAALVANVFPALHARRPLTIAQPVDPELAKQIPKAMDLAGEWWNYRPVDISVSEGQSAHDTAPGVGLFFSGGGDSFYSLFQGMDETTHLITIIGFDVKKSDTVRAGELRETAITVAEETGKIPIFVTTDVRRCRELARADWRHSHGSILAAVGHLLSDVLGEVRITAGFSLADLQPWGTHLYLDPLWSSSRLRVAHKGAEMNRTQRIQHVADEALVKKQLRVCWEYKNAGRNCGVCEKCLRTQMVLLTAGKLDGFSCFPSPDSLPERIGRLPYLKNPQIRGAWERFLAEDLDLRLRASIEELVLRTITHHTRMGSLVHGASTAPRRLARKIKIAMTAPGRRARKYGHVVG